jgi:hypothetical protein
MFEHLQYLRRNAVHSRALDLLSDPSSYPALAPLRSRDIRLQLYTLPSFEPLSTWTIYSPDEGKCIVRRIRWDRVADGALEIGSPTTFGADAWIEADVIEEYLGELSGMMISPFNMPNKVGLDGVTFGVRRRTFGCFAEVSWWCEPSPGNETLSDWYHRFVDKLEVRLPGATDPVPAEEILR